MKHGASILIALSCLLGGFACGDGGTGPSDTTPPEVAITAPQAGASVSGIVTVSATASDERGIAGVQFLLDGAALGAEDTESPYEVDWNTIDEEDGPYVLAARARDASGLTRTSTPRAVTLVNALGAIEITVDMDGAGSDPDGFDISIDGSAQARMAGEGSVTVHYVPAGTRVVSLEGVAPFCQDGHSATVDVVAGATVGLTFALTCIEGPGGRLLLRGSRLGPGELAGLDMKTGQLTIIRSKPWPPPDGDASPDGSKLALIQGTTLYVTDADGLNATPIAEVPAEASSPRWSPDGSTIVFVARRGAVGDLHLIDATGANLRFMFAAASDSLRDSPAWSVAGRIAYRAIDVVVEEWAIWTAAPDGSDATQLTFGDRDSGPAWSPDGSQLSFIAFTQVSGVWSSDLHVIDADGGNLRNLTDDPGGYGGFSAWSPDGEWLVFNRRTQLLAVHLSGSPVLLISDDYRLGVWPVSWVAGE